MNTKNTSIQYLNHASLLINDGDRFLLTDPWYDTKAFGKWMPVPPLFIHPVYLTSLAVDNESNFNILISNPDDDHCDDEYLKLFPKNINVIIPRYESKWFYERLKLLGFNNIIEIGKRNEVSNIKFRSHTNGTISIETYDALIFHSNKNNLFEEESALSINNHIQDYTSRIMHLKLDPKILLATQINTSQNDYPNTYSDYSDDDKEALTKKINKLFLSIVNMQIHNVLLYGGHDNYHLDYKKIGTYKDLNFYRSIAKEHLENKLNLIDITPGDIYHFNRVTSLFGEHKYTKETLKEQSLKFYTKP